MKNEKERKRINQLVHQKFVYLQSRA